MFELFALIASTSELYLYKKMENPLKPEWKKSSKETPFVINNWLWLDAT